MVILVTGGMGFIGSHTVRALANLGHGKSKGGAVAAPPEAFSGL